jgi:hypothetical protein
MVCESQTCIMDCSYFRELELFKQMPASLAQIAMMPHPRLD